MSCSVEISVVMYADKRAGIYGYTMGSGAVAIGQMPDLVHTSGRQFTDQCCSSAGANCIAVLRFLGLNPGWVKFFYFITFMFFCNQLYYQSQIL